MIRALRLVAILALVALLSSLYAAWRALALTGGILAPVPAAVTPGAPAGTARPGSDLLEVRLHYCSGATSYSLLSLPGDAAFSMGLANPATSSAIAGIPVTGGEATVHTTSAGTATPNGFVKAACAEAGTLNRRKLVLCRGQGPSHLIITVQSSAGSHAFALAMPACAGAGVGITPAIPGNSLVRP